MIFHYPAGIKNEKSSQKPPKSKISSLKSRKILSASNRGRDFEKAINETNEYYRNNALAVIYKRPTPINVVKVDYTKSATITKAYFEKQSTTDYNGVYQGAYLDFEAKSTHNKTSFPLSNIPHQQIEHLEAVIKQKGIAFFLIELKKKDEIYFLDAKFVISYYRKSKRKSIPFSELEKVGFLIKEGYEPRIDYLPIVKRLYFDINKNPS